MEGKIPEYQLLSSSCLVHKPTFVYRVEVDGVVATAPGQSKKKAKHAAAMSALQTLLKKYNDPVAEAYVASYMNQSGDHTTGVGLHHQDRMNDLNDTEVNSVGKLQELCMKKRWRPPVYETFEEIGAPHERLFKMTCEVKCESQSLMSTGVGRSKKLAKRSAAIEMLAQLESHSMIPENFLGPSGGVVTEISQTLKPQNNPLPPAFKPDLLHTSVIHAGDKVIDFMKGLGEELNHELDIVLKEEEDPTQALNTVADFLECQVQYHEMPSTNSKIHVSTVQLIPMDTFHFPIAIVAGFGSGSSQEESRQQAAVTAISFFKVNRHVN